MSGVWGAAGCLATVGGGNYRLVAGEQPRGIRDDGGWLVAGWQVGGLGLVWATKEADDGCHVEGAVGVAAPFERTVAVVGFKVGQVKKAGRVTLTGAGLGRRLGVVAGAGTIEEGDHGGHVEGAVKIAAPLKGGVAKAAADVDGLLDDDHAVFIVSLHRLHASQWGCGDSELLIHDAGRNSVC